MRNCVICCGDINAKNNRVKYCSDSCRKEANKITQKKYNLNNHSKRIKTWRNYRIRTGRSKTVWTECLVNTCVECGNQFHPPKMVPYKKYCSPQCRGRQNQRNHKKKNPESVKASMWRYDHSEKRSTNRKKRYPKQRYYQKDWLRKNPRKSSEYSKRNREKYPERDKEKRKRFRKTQKYIFSNRLRSHVFRVMKKNGIVLSPKKENRDKIITLAEGNFDVCPLCKNQVKNIRDFRIAHIFSITKYPSRAGDIDNIILLCDKCNRKMYNHDFIHFCNLSGHTIPERVLYVYKKYNQNLQL